MRFSTCLLLFAASVAFSQSPQSGIVKGIIISGRQPLRKAEVTLSLASDRSPLSGTTYGMTTGADGTFLFDEVPAGEYQLSVKRTALGESLGGVPQASLGRESRWLP